MQFHRLLKFAPIGVCLFTGCSFQSAAPRVETAITPLPTVAVANTVLAVPVVFKGEPEPLYPEVEVPNVPEVNHWVREYNNERKSCLRSALERRQAYAATFQPVFERHGLPPELVHVAMVESAYQPLARSRSGAVGMWQFIAGTARSYGLKIGTSVDERKDVAKATDAAARHLVDLYRTYRDWALVLAAYNSGSGTVNRAIARSGSRNFFELARRGMFPKETVNYVSRFMALALIHRDIHPYRLSDEPTALQLARAENAALKIPR